MLSEVIDGLKIIKRYYPDAILLDLDTIRLIEKKRGIFPENDYRTLVIVFDEKMNIFKDGGIVYDDNMTRDASDKLENLGWWLTLRGWEFEG